MVAGRVKAVMGFQRSPATPKSESVPRRLSISPASHDSATPSGASGPPPQQRSTPKSASAFARSFGAYFPKSSAQVQPRPPDVAELLRLVEVLRERESRLRTQLLEQKILKETVAIVPFLEKELAARTGEAELARESMARLEAENAALRAELDGLQARERARWEEEEWLQRERREKEMEVPRRAAAESKEADECSSSSRRLQCPIDAFSEISPKSNHITPNLEVNKPERSNDHSKEEKGESEETQQSRCISRELSKSLAARMPNPPPLPSFDVSKSYYSTTRNSSSTSTTATTSSSSSASSESTSASSASRVPRPRLSTLPPIPPPFPTGSDPLSCRRQAAKPAPPPPPPLPPMPARGPKSAATAAPGPFVRRVPEVVEFYHSLMRRDLKRDPGGGVSSEPASAAASARDMIGEIENRSAHLLAIKTDIETQGDFIRFLIKEVEGAAFASIDNVVAFVKRLDDELSCLVDERAVLKHFEWPEQKADALREAAFGYCDLKKLEAEAASFRDDARQPCSSSLKKMQVLFEKLEHGIYNLARMREGTANRYRGFQIPLEWMSEGGIASQIKLASVKLAMKYMKRVSSELEDLTGGGPEEEELILQGVRFAFRVHQFAGGFDVDTMRAFQELKEKASSFHIQHSKAKINIHSKS